MIRNAELLGKSVSEIRQCHSGKGEALYAAKECGLVLNLLPEDAIALPAEEFLALLRRRYGDDTDTALSPRWTDPDTPSRESPPVLQGPAAKHRDAAWLRRTNMAGVNIRTVRDFPGVAKYALTLSDAHDSVHLLPVWEPGVIGSLYGMASWQINGEFFSRELAALHPHLNSPARQLKATVNLLHLMGKAVGMDVIPHTDRFSEIVLAHPAYFEWLRRNDALIINSRANLHEEVEGLVRDFLAANGDALSGRAVPKDALERLFQPDFDEERRNAILFGAPDKPDARLRRRLALAKAIYSLGYETVPATMAPPYRGLTIDPDILHTDENGQVWREYSITKPQSMSRVFGPLTRYKLYERLNDNREWAIDFEHPRREVWNYVQEHYAAVQAAYGFDFMRGDMSHVQMRPQGVPSRRTEYYDILGAVRSAICGAGGAPWFGYFAESFLAAPGVMGYGNEMDHLETAGADTVLGDLQSLSVQDPQFARQLRRYLDFARTRQVSPSFTVMTSDKDDPRFDEFYRHGNEARYFTSLFLSDMPSYTALNFACRDTHHSPAPNEHYTKSYVINTSTGPKAVHGPFVFGKNSRLFYGISRIRLFAENMLPRLREAVPHLLLLPEEEVPILAWALSAAPRGTSGSGEYLLCAVNFGCNEAKNLRLPLRRFLDSIAPAGEMSLRSVTLLFSTDDTRPPGPYGELDKDWLTLPALGAGEGCAFCAQVVNL
ncbi:MAG: hypothetical protein B0D92_06235 [Spirochaeta sp. LUC14_002_19_P3]|nr:MAG: hypothetical protein B0D92_06235 [Spirochaeta sp. LUC14_002_19_P3]